MCTYLASQSAVFVAAGDFRRPRRCFRCGCPVAYYDRYHCSSPNLRTRPQHTSITTRSTAIMTIILPFVTHFFSLSFRKKKTLEKVEKQLIFQFKLIYFKNIKEQNYLLCATNSRIFHSLSNKLF